MILSDVLPFDRSDKDQIIEISRDVRNVVIDSVDAIKDSVGATKDAIADSISQSQVVLDSGGASQSEVSLGVMIVVAAALAGCFYLAHLYRRHLGTQA